MGDLNIFFIFNSVFVNFLNHDLKLYRKAGGEIQSLAKSVYKAEAETTGMHASIYLHPSLGKMEDKN